MASATCSSSPISLSNRPSSHSSPSLTSFILNLRSSSFSSSHFTSPSSLSLALLHHIKPTFITSAPKCTIKASSTTATNKKKVLIVNTNSGGHAVIGFYFAKDLLSSGHDVTVLTVGDESSDKMKKPPFTRFHELVPAGGSTVWGSPNDVRTAVGGHKFDVVLDNNGKDLDTVKPVADWAKSSGAEQFLYISSAGIYKPTDEVPHVEGGITLKLKPDSKVALVGPSGGGKVSIVSQEPILFNCSIEENIAYCLTGNTSSADIDNVAKMANAHEFVSKFPEKYKTHVGERGVRLSGGQKQRIAIARALLMNPRVLLLDEATSALDAESEYLVQDAMDSLMKGRTVLVIAHRLSTVKSADTVAVISDGQIAESGTHDELLNKNGIYTALVKRQLEGGGPKVEI